MKIGDGITRWNELEYFFSESDSIKEVCKEFVVGHDDMTLKDRIEAIENNFRLLKNWASA